MYKFTVTNFTPKQLGRYKTLRFIFNFAGWFSVACIAIPFTFSILTDFINRVFYVDISLDFPMFGIIVFALVLWLVLRSFVANRCFNCFKFNGLKEISETVVSDWSKYGVEKSKRDITQIMAIKQMKCNKCGFECQQITLRTGNLDGIGRMSRDIKRGGKTRLKGENYTSWWRRNKS
jgi:hypothetical protein